MNAGSRSDTRVFRDLQEFRARLPAQGALMGIDPGERRIGLAISDAGRLIASPLATITKTRREQDFAGIITALGERSPVGIVVGWARNLDGRSGPAAQKSAALAHFLAARLDQPTLLWDERLSTAAVTRSLIAGDASRRRRAEIVDETAAAYILQGAIDALGYV